MRGRLHPSASEGHIALLQEEELLERGRRMQRELNAQQEEQAQRLRSDEERLRARQAVEEATLASTMVGQRRLVQWVPGNPKILAYAGLHAQPIYSCLQMFTFNCWVDPAVGGATASGAGGAAGACGS